MENGLIEFLQNQSLSETIEVLDEMLYLIVLNIELMDIIPDKLTHQYLTIRELRDFFIDLNQQEHVK
ncbi:MAG: hypothetical protein JXR03_21175 [Cyclobacteriaceae bacterium]